MGIYTKWRDGYKRETIWGTSSITAAADITYLLGLMPTDAPAVHPASVPTIEYGPTAVNMQEVSSDMQFVTEYVSSGLYTFGVQNGVFLEFAMGKSATTGPVSTIYTHAITPPTAVSGVLPPLKSFTIHHEKTGSGTSWATQFLGCTVNAMNLKCTLDTLFLIVGLDIFAKKNTDPNLGGTNAMLTTDPALPATANADPFHINNMTVTYDSVDITEYIAGVELKVNNSLKEVRTPNWDTGTYVGYYPLMFLHNWRKKYELILTMTPYADDIFDAVIDPTSSKDIVIKWTRHSTDDYIQATMSTKPSGHPMQTPKPGEGELIEVTFAPYTLAFEVKDKLAGSFYGE